MLQRFVSRHFFIVISLALVSLTQPAASSHTSVPGSLQTSVAPPSTSAKAPAIRMLFAVAVFRRFRKNAHIHCNLSPLTKHLPDGKPSSTEGPMSRSCRSQMHTQDTSHSATKQDVRHRSYASSSIIWISVPVRRIITRFLFSALNSTASHHMGSSVEKCSPWQSAASAHVPRHLQIRTASLRIQPQ